MDGRRWKKSEKIPQQKIFLFSCSLQRRLLPEEAKEHSMNIDDFVSKPVNPLQLLDSIQRIFSRRNEISLERQDAQNKGLDTTIIDEYAMLRKNIEVDRNLLVVLRTSSGLDIGREVSSEDVNAIRNLEDKIRRAEHRLRELKELLGKIPDSSRDN